MFGKDVRFFDENEDTVCVKAKVNEAAMVQFAKSYAPDVEVLEPSALRERIEEEIKKGFKIYK